MKENSVDAQKAGKKRAGEGNLFKYNLSKMNPGSLFPPRGLANTTGFVILLQSAIKLLFEHLDIKDILQLDSQVHI